MSSSPEQPDLGGLQRVPLRLLWLRDLRGPALRRPRALGHGLGHQEAQHPVGLLGAGAPILRVGLLFNLVLNVFCEK